MTRSYAKSTAIAVLPAVSRGQLQDRKLRTWLCRASLRHSSEPREPLACVLDALNLPYPDAGIAALRMWGQTGDRPTVWIAAADPVYLEPRLDHVCLYALRNDLMPVSDLRVIFDHLQDTLADTARYGFARIGHLGYLRSETPMATAAVPAYAVDQQLPNDFMPTGPETNDYRSLTSEVEMSLHEHEVNLRREADGLPPVNSLWLWGGGRAPEQQSEPLPPLFANDPLMQGYWLCNNGAVSEWPGSIAACLQASPVGFVAVPNCDVDDVEVLQNCLHELRTALRSGHLDRLILFFRDGVEVAVGRADAWRFWRRSSPLID